MRIETGQNRKRPKKPPIDDGTQDLFVAFLVATSLSMLAMVCGIALALA